MIVVQRIRNETEFLEHGKSESELQICLYSNIVSVRIVAEAIESGRSSGIC